MKTREIERRIAEAVVDAALAAGHSITVNNGGDQNEIQYSTDLEEILGVMFGSDEDLLTLNHEEPGRWGWIRFVYGNSGWDVLHDNHIRLEPLLAKARRLADHYSN